MSTEFQTLVLYGLIAITTIAAVAYYYLSSILAKSNDVLAVWEKIAETPILGNFVGQIYTIFVRIRIPYSRSIGTAPTHLTAGLT
jgi:hypothetical protein